MRLWLTELFIGEREVTLGLAETGDAKMKHQQKAKPDRHQI